jgi:hypothetical protein
MKLKRFDPTNRKKGVLAPKGKGLKGEPVGPVGRGDPQTKKGASAPHPTGSVGMFYEPDRSFTPNTTKTKPKSKPNPATKKTTIGRSTASTKMAKKSKKKDINSGIRG